MSVFWGSRIWGHDLAILPPVLSSCSSPSDFPIKVFYFPLPAFQEAFRVLNCAFAASQPDFRLQIAAAPDFERWTEGLTLFAVLWWVFAAWKRIRLLRFWVLALLSWLLQDSAAKLFSLAEVSRLSFVMLSTFRSKLFQPSRALVTDALQFFRQLKVLPFKTTFPLNFLKQASAFWRGGLRK